MDALGHQPDLIKIDVEGAAVDVLKGAEKTLETARAIVLEIHNDAEGVGAIQFSKRTRVPYPVYQSACQRCHTPYPRHSVKMLR